MASDDLIQQRLKQTQNEERYQLSTLGRWGWTLFYLALVAGVVLLFLVGLQHNPGLTLFLGIFGFVFVLAMIAQMYYIWKAHLTDQLFDSINLEIQPQPVQPGEDLTMKLTFTTKKQFRANSINLLLVSAWTHTTYDEDEDDMGRDRDLDITRLHEESLSFSDVPERFAPGASRMYELACSLPESYPEPYQKKPEAFQRTLPPVSGLHWGCIVTINIPWFPNWRKRYGIDVSDESPDEHSGGR